MGNRAIIIFTDGEEFSPTTYMHWNGGDVAPLLTELLTLMADRGADLSYCSARFVGIIHSHMEGNLSLGMFNTSTDGLLTATGRLPYGKWLAELSHGDAGAFLVDFRTMQCHCYGGYGLVIGTERLANQAVPLSMLSMLSSAKTWAGRPVATPSQA